MEPYNIVRNTLRPLLLQGLLGILLSGCASLERYPDNPRL